MRSPPPIAADELAATGSRGPELALGKERRNVELP
jgi:hypothetical protein